MLKPHLRYSHSIVDRTQQLGVVSSDGPVFLTSPVTGFNTFRDGVRSGRKLYVLVQSVETLEWTIYYALFYQDHSIYSSDVLVPEVAFDVVEWGDDTEVRCFGVAPASFLNFKFKPYFL